MNNSAKSGGITIWGLLGIAFIILKLCGVINWSWLWVLCPFWGGAVLAIGLFIIMMVLTIIGSMFK